MMTSIGHWLQPLTVIACLICGIVYICLKRRYRYWSDLGVRGPAPELVLGNMREAYSLKCTEAELLDKWYQQYTGEDYIGVYTLWKPALMVKDPGLIKKILEGDFLHFTDHPQFSGGKGSDAVFDSLFNQRGALWKGNRQVFSRLFTPMKMKEYLKIMDHYNPTLMKYVEEHKTSSGEIELCDMAEKHLALTIAAVVYNLDLSNDKERSSKLVQLSEEFARPPPSTAIMFLLYSVAPGLFQFLGLKTFSNVFWNFFSSFTEELLQSRKDIGNPDDLVGLITKLQKERSMAQKLTHGESVGHIFGFFMAGHHTTLTTLGYVIYELSRHPRVQDKLREEVDEILNGKEQISYESVKRMTYMDDVLNETMRIYTLVGVLKRTCNTPYKINSELTIPEGMDVLVPVQSLHMDPRYFPEPHEFRPERFSNSEIPPFVFMPFGKGPRICIGQRLAYIALKVTLAGVLSKYKISSSCRTKSPIQFDPKTVIITVRPVGGLWVKMERRV